MSKITFFECSKCGERVPAEKPATVCPKDGGVLYARYDLAAIKKTFTPAALVGRRCDLWRYAEVLPDAEPVSLGEGLTPMIPSREYKKVYVKDEGLNPTGSFKARGLCVAITMAKAYGIKKVAVPSAGNAASALAAYAAAADIEAHIFMPKDVPRANLVECLAYGAKVTLVDGLISDCARIVGERKQAEGWFDISTLKEPFRVEGKKTMGYEVAEQLGWKLPDAIIYPTGGGVGLIGMWKAFEEMESLGWIGAKRPKMVVVQSSGCAPVSKAFDEHRHTAKAWPQAHTLAAGLRVPKPYGDYIILDILEKSKGIAIAVSDDEILAAVQHWAQTEGIFAAPEGAASLVAYQKLRARNFLTENDVTVLFNTGSGIKYVDVIAAAQEDAAKKDAQKSAASQPATRNIGGIIGPY
jgi:threonine synthase